MYVHDPQKYQAMVKSYQEKGDPLGWFDTIYTNAKGDYRQVFWADLEPSPYMLSWLDTCSESHKGKRAIVIGCGVGDDAVALEKYGYRVTAFDISPEAIRLCKKRYPDSLVDFVVADLFDYPSSWEKSFDLIYECNTIQVLPKGEYRLKAQQAMVSLVAPKGNLLVSCRSRNSGEMEDAIPLPLDKKEISLFRAFGLRETYFLAYDDNQEPPVPHFFACFTRD